MPYVPCVFTALEASNHLLTTVPLTRNSMDGPATRTSNALTDRPFASGVLTAFDAVFGRTVSVLSSPTRRFTSHVPSWATRK